MVGNKQFKNDTRLRKHRIPDDLAPPLLCDVFSPFRTQLCGHLLLPGNPLSGPLGNSAPGWTRGGMWNGHLTVATP